MSDPSGTQFLSGLLNLGKATQTSQSLTAKPFDTGDIIRLLNQSAQQKFGPNANKDNQTQNEKRTEGKVLQKNSDGSYRLRVQDSELDVKLSQNNNQSPLKTGQRLLIDIIPNAENLSALPSIKISLASQINAQQQIQDTRLSATPLNLELSGKPNQTALPQNTLQTALSTGQEIRFLPIAASAEVIIPPVQNQSTQLSPNALFSSLPESQAPLSAGLIQTSTQAAGLAVIQQSQTGLLDHFLSNLSNAAAPQTSSTAAPPSTQTQTLLNVSPPQDGGSINLGQAHITPPLIATSSSSTFYTQNTLTKGQALQGQLQTLQAPSISLNAPAQSNNTVPSSNIGGSDINNARQPPLINQAAALIHTPGSQLGHITMQLIGLSETHTPIFQAVQSNSFYASNLSGEQNYTVPTPINPAQAQIGSQITISPQVHNLRNDGMSGFDIMQPPSIGVMMTPGLWPSMQMIQSNLSAPTQSQGAQAFSSLIPNAAAPSNIPQAALFFIAAIRAGDISGWLGEKNTEMLRQSGRGNLLARLTQEGGLLNRLATEAGGSDWRTMSLPMAWQNEVHKITLRYRQEEHENHDGEDNKNNTRFIMDLSLSNMGELQLDGLYRPGHLDVIVRSENNFGEAMRMSMKQLYIKSLEQTDLKGELQFQHTKKNWVQIKPTKDQLSWNA